MATLIKNRQIVSQLSPPDLVLGPTDDPALVAGQAVHGQWWFRDPDSSFDSGLSNALALGVQS